ncbi:S8 family serine peptidase [Stenotrophomonas geniculata]|uniref:S8 family serine peptidase n=1 Tax=Stenotrophomonas geniculata TaxID=86188 RepID=UPI003AAFF4D8
MMKTAIFFILLAFLAMIRPAWAQSSAQSPPADVRPNADRQGPKASVTGRSFDVGGTRFRLAPAPASSARTGIRKDRFVDAGAGKFANAVSSDGAKVLTTSRVMVYFTDASSVRLAANSTGGKVIRVSSASGRAIVEYPSVNDALDASTKLRAISGIRATELDLIQWEEVH